MKNEPTWIHHIHEYTFKFKVVKGKLYLRITNGTEPGTGDMHLTHIQVDDLRDTLRYMKEKSGDDVMDDEEFKKKYTLIERLMLRKEVMKDSRGETKL